MTMKKNVIPENNSAIFVLFNARRAVSCDPTYYFNKPADSCHENSPVEIYEYDADWLKAKAWDEIEMCLPSDREGVKSLFDQLIFASHYFGNKPPKEYQYLISGLFEILRKL